MPEPTTRAHNSYMDGQLDAMSTAQLEDVLKDLEARKRTHERAKTVSYIRRLLTLRASVRMCQDTNQIKVLTWFILGIAVLGVAVSAVALYLQVGN